MPVAMVAAVAAVAAAAVAAAALAAVDDLDGIQWWWWWGHLMAATTAATAMDYDKVMVRQRWCLTPAAAGGDGREGGSSVGLGGGGIGGGGRGGCRWSIVVNATIFLPLLEDAFVNANNPHLARYREAGNPPKGANCGTFIFGNS
jgi:hypothetical protein